MTQTIRQREAIARYVELQRLEHSIEVLRAPAKTEETVDVEETLPGWLAFASVCIVTLIVAGPEVWRQLVIVLRAYGLH